jgi:prevent-host-death family protein
MKPSKVTTITATEMQHKSGEIIRRAYTDNEHFIVERSGYPMVVIVPLAYYRAFTDSGTLPKHETDCKRGKAISKM